PSFGPLMHTSLQLESHPLIVAEQIGSTPFVALATKHFCPEPQMSCVHGALSSTTTSSSCQSLVDPGVALVDRASRTRAFPNPAAPASYCWNATTGLPESITIEVNFPAHPLLTLVISCELHLLPS